MDFPSIPYDRTGKYEARLGAALIDEIVRAYVGGASATAIAARHHLAAPAVAGILRRRSQTLRRGPEYLRKHHPVGDFFDEINTEEKAYVLGFITADGCIHALQNSLSIELSEKDRAHLERLRDAISPGQALRPHIHRGHGYAIRQWRLHVTSPPIVAALGKLGVGPAKSMTVRPCELIPPHLLRHYWRGVLDGDGSIVDKRGKKAASLPVWNFELTGSKAMCEGFRAFIKDNGVNTKAVVAPAGGVARFGVGGQRLARRAAELMYGDCTISLPRKHAAAEAVLAQSGRVDSGNRFLGFLVRFCAGEGIALKETAEHLRISGWTLWKIRRANGLGRINSKRQNPRPKPA